MSVLDLATVACEVRRPPVADSFGVVRQPEAWLNRTCVGLLSLDGTTQQYQMDSPRKRWQTFIFGADAADAATVREIQEGHTLVVGAVEHAIIRADFYDQLSDRGRYYVHLIVEEVRHVNA